MFSSNTEDRNQKGMNIMGEFGGEYLLQRQFSVAESVDSASPLRQQKPLLTPVLAP